MGLCTCKDHWPTFRTTISISHLCYMKKKEERERKQTLSLSNTEIIQKCSFRHYCFHYYIPVPHPHLRFRDITEDDSRYAPPLLYMPMGTQLCKLWTQLRENYVDETLDLVLTMSAYQVLLQFVKPVEVVSSTKVLVQINQRCVRPLSTNCCFLVTFDYLGPQQVLRSMIWRSDQLNYCYFPWIKILYLISILLSDLEWYANYENKGKINLKICELPQVSKGHLVNLSYHANKELTESRKYYTPYTFIIKNVEL